jgi:hypothetical protein
MALTGMAKPDHSTICQFRMDHRKTLSELFVQVLALCREAGMAKQIKDLTGSYPAQVPADAGHCSEANIVATGSGCRPDHRNRATGHGTASPTNEVDKAAAPRTRAMREWLSAGGFTSPCRQRVRSLNRPSARSNCEGTCHFLHRRLAKVQGEWSMVCTTQNLLKLHAVRN